MTWGFARVCNHNQSMLATTSNPCLQPQPTHNPRYPCSLHTPHCASPTQMMRAVYELLGEVVHPDQPLMAAGLDSRGAMELRNTLQEQLGLEVPNTMLYDAQTVGEAVAYLDRLLMEHAGGGEGAAGGSGVQGGANAGVEVRVDTAATATTATTTATPSYGLLKTLRYPLLCMCVVCDGVACTTCPTTPPLSPTGPPPTLDPCFSSPLALPTRRQPTLPLHKCWIGAVSPYTC